MSDLDTSTPFTRGEGLAAGLTVNDLAGPRLVRIFQGIYVASHVKLTAFVRARAALRVAAPGAWVSHHTAGEICGGWMPKTADTHITVPAGTSRSERRGIRAHCARPGAVPRRRKGLPISSPTEIFLELAAVGTDLVDLVVAGDSLVRTTSVTPQDLLDAAEHATGKGSKLARRAARFVRSGVDSAQESRLRMLIVLAGLPEPATNLIIRGSDGEWLRRLELYYPDVKVAVEYDGQHHREDSRQWSRDLLRREQLESWGWRIIVINADALNGDPLGTLLRVQGALRERGHRDLRRSLTTTWQRHFPARRAAA